MKQASPLVEMRGICKRYGGVHALQNVDFTVYPREIHALVGDNAAGKSTLIKVLSGAVTLDEGEIHFEGQAMQIGQPSHAKALGIETVYQDLALADNLDIPSNVFLGRELMCGGVLRPFLNLRKMEQEAETLLSRLKIRIPSLRQRVRTLSGGQRQCVAIARSVYFNARLIILDEPTAALGVEETRKVLQLVREMRDQGLSVVMISHNLTHVFDLCDRITVMKTGRVAGSRHISETNHDEILRLIVTGGAQRSEVVAAQL
ncbi:MAG TPA: ATP-binding cassette domain-containing protein [Burkholderiales bacterium]|nr:ATP-binding cassette domain-containing protein [Burkholderiales bacterium]